MFFTFKQRKANGYYVLSHRIGHVVIIEAEDHYDAVSQADQVGLYFDGVSFGIDKNIDRWDMVYGGYGTQKPTIDGVSLDEYDPFDKKIVVVYYIDSGCQVIVKQRSH